MVRSRSEPYRLASLVRGCSGQADDPAKRVTEFFRDIGVGSDGKLEQLRTRMVDALFRLTFYFFLISE